MTRVACGKCASEKCFNSGGHSMEAQDRQESADLGNPLKSWRQESDKNTGLMEKNTQIPGPHCYQCIFCHPEDVKCFHGPKKDLCDWGEWGLKELRKEISDKPLSCTRNPALHLSSVKNAQTLLKTSLAPKHQLNDAFCFWRRGRWQFNNRVIYHVLFIPGQSCHNSLYAVERMKLSSCWIDLTS